MNKIKIIFTLKIKRLLLISTQMSCPTEIMIDWIEKIYFPYIKQEPLCGSV